MLSIKNCIKTLNKGERKYREEEIKNIRDYLYFIGELQLNNNEYKKYKL